MNKGPWLSWSEAYDRLVELLRDVPEAKTVSPGAGDDLVVQVHPRVSLDRRLAEGLVRTSSEEATFYGWSIYIDRLSRARYPLRRAFDELRLLLQRHPSVRRVREGDDELIAEVLPYDASSTYLPLRVLGWPVRLHEIGSVGGVSFGASPSPSTGPVLAVGSLLILAIGAAHLADRRLEVS